MLLRWIKKHFSSFLKGFHIPKVRIWKLSQYENASALHSVLNMSEYQNMPECILGYKYAKNLNMAGFWICILQYKARGHSISKWVLIGIWAYLVPCQRSKIESFGRKKIAFNYSRKTLCLKSLRGFWICVRF